MKQPPSNSNNQVPPGGDPRLNSEDFNRVEVGSDFVKVHGKTYQNPNVDPSQPKKPIDPELLRKMVKPWQEGTYGTNSALDSTNHPLRKHKRGSLRETIVETAGKIAHKFKKHSHKKSGGHGRGG